MASYSIKYLASVLVDLAIAVWAFVMILSPSLITPALGPSTLVVAVVGVVYIAIFILYVTCSARDGGIGASNIPVFHSTSLVEGVLYLVACIGIIIIASGRSNRALLSPLVYTQLTAMYLVVFWSAVAAVTWRTLSQSMSAVQYY